MNNPFNKQTFCKRLRESRKLSKLTQADLGRKVNLKSAEVSHYERGYRLPGPEKLAALCVATGANPAWLLGLTD